MYLPVPRYSLLSIETLKEQSGIHINKYICGSYGLSKLLLLFLACKVCTYCGLESPIFFFRVQQRDDVLLMHHGSR